MLTLYKKSDAYEPFSITPQHPDAQNLLYMAVLEASACVCVCVCVREREREGTSKHQSDKDRKTDCSSSYTGFSLLFSSQLNSASRCQ